jgi:hypothetical protein
MIREKDEYISLREAAEMTGYTPDYVGQLIRNGKLPGKQVFSNVAWMTTREAILEYVNKDNKSETEKKNWFVTKKEWLTSPEGISMLFTCVGWIVAGLFGISILFFAYIAAVSIDHRISEKHIEKIQYEE